LKPASAASKFKRRARSTSLRAKVLAMRKHRFDGLRA
jgi:hypothetical protein